jgi:hypothetical protein
MVCQASQVIPVNKTIDKIKKNSHEHNGKRHLFAFCPQPEGENQGAVDIVDHVKGEKQPGHYVMFQGAEQEKAGKYKQGRGFHYNPSPAVADRCTPFRGCMPPVGRNRFYNEWETDQCNGYPYIDKNIEC